MNTRYSEFAVLWCGARTRVRVSLDIFQCFNLLVFFSDIGLLDAEQGFRRTRMVFRVDGLVFAFARKHIYDAYH